MQRFSHSVYPEFKCTQEYQISIRAGILNQVIAFFLYQNVLFLTTHRIIIYKRKHSRGLDKHIHEHLYHNV